jgi:hypothetical protein
MSGEKQSVGDAGRSEIDSDSEYSARESIWAQVSGGREDFRSEEFCIMWYSLHGTARPQFAVSSMECNPEYVE